MLSQKQGKQLNRAECKFRTAPLLIPREGYPPTGDTPQKSQLAFGCEGGGGGGRCVETTKKNHLQLTLDTREVVAEVLMEQPKKTTSDSHLDAREVVVVAEGLKQPKKATSGSRLDAREVEVGWWQGGTCGRRHIRITLLGLDSPALVPRLSSSSSLLWVVVTAVAHRCCAVITHRRCGAVGVFRLHFVHYIGVGCKVVRMHHMGLPFHRSPLVPPPLSPVPSEHERNLPTSQQGMCST